MAPGMVPRMKISQPGYRTVTAATDFKILLPAVTVRGWELLETKLKGQIILTLLELITVRKVSAQITPLTGGTRKIIKRWTSKVALVAQFSKPLTRMKKMPRNCFRMNE